MKHNKQIAPILASLATLSLLFVSTGAASARSLSSLSPEEKNYLCDLSNKMVTSGENIPGFIYKNRRFVNNEIIVCHLPSSCPPDRFCPTLVRSYKVHYFNSAYDVLSSCSPGRFCPNLVGSDKTSYFNSAHSVLTRHSDHLGPTVVRPEDFIYYAVVYNEFNEQHQLIVNLTYRVNEYVNVHGRLPHVSQLGEIIKRFPDYTPTPSPRGRYTR
jgi:hypothetical protein